MLKIAVRYDDIIGRRFGRLVAYELISPSKAGARRWRLRCDCGRDHEAEGCHLRRGIVRSCGCERATQGGLTAQFKPESAAWASARRRCMDPSNRAYARYGGRGITMDPTWVGPDGLANFIADMGPRPSPQHSLDRYPDNDGPYAPGNCRWATAKEQQNNRRNSVILTYEGEALPLSEWSRRYKISHCVIHARLKSGWPVAEAITTPLKRVARK